MGYTKDLSGSINDISTAISSLSASDAKDQLEDWVTEVEVSAAHQHSIGLFELFLDSHDAITEDPEETEELRDILDFICGDRPPKPRI